MTDIIWRLTVQRLGSSPVCTLDLQIWTTFTFAFPYLLAYLLSGEARDIEQNLRPCIHHRSSNYMESASIESQNSYLDWTVFPCSKDSSVHSWLISWLTPAPLTRYFHWWIMAPYTNWMNEWMNERTNEWMNVCCSSGARSFSVQWLTMSIALSSLGTLTQPMTEAGSYVARHTHDGQLLAVAVNQPNSHCSRLVFVAVLSSVITVADMHGMETRCPITSNARSVGRFSCNSHKLYLYLCFILVVFYIVFVYSVSL